MSDITSTTVPEGGTSRINWEGYSIAVIVAATVANFWSGKAQGRRDHRYHRPFASVINWQCFFSNAISALAGGFLGTAYGPFGFSLGGVIGCTIPFFSYYIGYRQGFSSQDLKEQFSSPQQTENPPKNNPLSSRFSNSVPSAPMTLDQDWFNKYFDKN